MASAAVNLMPADDFLVWSQDQEARCELVDGFPIEKMTGAGDVRDRIVVNGEPATNQGPTSELQ